MLKERQYHFLSAQYQQLKEGHTLTNHQAGWLTSIVLANKRNKLYKMGVVSSSYSITHWFQVQEYLFSLLQQLCLI